MSIDNQPRFPRITIGSRGEVVVTYLIFAGILYSKQIKLPTILAIEPEPKTLARHEASNCIRGPTSDYTLLLSVKSFI